MIGLEWLGPPDLKEQTLVHFLVIQNLDDSKRVQPEVGSYQKKFNLKKWVIMQINIGKLFTQGEC